MWVVLNLFLVIVIATVTAASIYIDNKRFNEIQTNLTKQEADQKQRVEKVSKDVTDTNQKVASNRSEFEKSLQDVNAKMDKNTKTFESNINTLQTNNDQQFQEIKTETSGIRTVLDETTAKANEALAPRSLTFTGMAYVRLLDTALHDTTRSENAGRIGYKIWSEDALDVIGGSQDEFDETNRKVRIWDKLQTDKVQLGDKWLLSGKGSKEDDEWLRLMDKDDKNYYGGYAADRLYAHSDATFAGGNSEYNKDKLRTMFPSKDDGKNYIRGDTELTGHLNVEGALTTKNNICVEDSCLTKTDFDRVKTSSTAALPQCRSLSTPLNEVGTNPSFLDRHTVECGDDERLTSIKLTTQGQQIRYDYKCCK